LEENTAPARARAATALLNPSTTTTRSPSRTSLGAGGWSGRASDVVDVSQQKSIGPRACDMSLAREVRRHPRATRRGDHCGTGRDE